jgi:hypothetical protein
VLAHNEHGGVNDEGVLLVQHAHCIIEHGGLNAARVSQLLERVTSYVNFRVAEHGSPPRRIHGTTSYETTQRQHAVSSSDGAQVRHEQRQALVARVKARPEEFPVEGLY